MATGLYPKYSGCLYLYVYHPLCDEYQSVLIVQRVEYLPTVQWVKISASWLLVCTHCTLGVYIYVYHALCDEYQSVLIVQWVEY